MNVIHIFSSFFLRLRNVSVKLLQNECPHMSAMIFIFVDLRMNTKGKYDAVNSE
jgi:hypothetical protein